MTSLLIAFGIGTLLSASGPVDGSPVNAWTGRTVAGGGFEFALLDDVMLQTVVPLPADAPLLLASVVADRDTPTRASDPWWSMEPIRIMAPREPTDPDSPGLPLLGGSPLETPWDAWESQEDLRGDWESMDPGDR